MHIHIFTCLNKSLGFRHKLLLVQQLPKAVMIDWTQVLRIIKDISSIIIEPSISGNHIKAESFSIRLITLFPVRPLVHSILYHYQTSFFLGRSQSTSICNYFQALSPFHVFRAVSSSLAEYNVFKMAYILLHQSLGLLKQSWPYKPLVYFLCQINQHMVNSYWWSLLLLDCSIGLSKS